MSLDEDGGRTEELGQEIRSPLQGTPIAVAGEPQIRQSWLESRARKNPFPKNEQMFVIVYLSGEISWTYVLRFY